MSDIPISSTAAPAAWPWLAYVRAARRRIILATFAGLLTFAAVVQLVVAPVDCKRKVNAFQDANGNVLEDQNGSTLKAGPDSLKCKTPYGSFGFDLPAWLTQ
jgi:hypothetical protein